MQTERDPSLITQIIATTIQFSLVGVANALPLALVATLFFGGQVGKDMWFLGAVLVGSWFPLQSVIRVYIRKSASVNYIPTHLNIPFLILSVLPYFFMAPILWAVTFFALLLGIIAYVLSGQVLLIALLVALGYQVFSIFREPQDEEWQNPSFTFNVQDVSSVFAQFSDQSRLGEDTTDLDEEKYSRRLLQSDDADIIILDSDSVHKRDESDDS